MDKILSEASNHLANKDPRKAEEVLTKGAEKYPNEISILELLATTYMEEAKTEEGYETFLKCAELDKDGLIGGCEKFFWLGQISGGREAIKWIERGMNGLRKKLLNGESDNDNDDINNIISRSKLDNFEKEALINEYCEAICSSVEVWMTDLCMEPEAEERCEALIEKALKVAPNNVDTLALSASVKISQNRKEEAKVVVKHCWEILEKEVKKSTESAFSDLYDLVRKLESVAKLFSELKMHKEVLEVCQYITYINDQSVSGWYLSGITHQELSKLGEQEGENGIEKVDRYENANMAIMDLEKTLASLDIEGSDDTEFREEIHKTIKVLKSDLKDLKKDREDMMDEDEIEDGDEIDGWEDEIASDNE